MSHREQEHHGFLLDTNIISALVRQPTGVIFERIREQLPVTVCTSIVVAAEIQFGLHKGVSSRLYRQVERVLSELDILPLESPAERHYGEIRAHLQRIGQPIGSNDLLIAAHARSLDLTLVSDNLREFQRVPSLKLVNWLQT